MKLTSFRKIDQVHLLDMIGVGIIDATFENTLPEELAVRLRLLLEKAGRSTDFGCVLCSPP